MHRDKLNRDTAPVPVYIILHRGVNRSLIKLVPRPHLRSATVGKASLHAIKLVPCPPSPRLRRAKTAKTRAIPSLSTGTIIRLKHQDRNGGRRVTQPPFIAGLLAVSSGRQDHNIGIIFVIISILTDCR
jgi:hypothetical protein